MNDPSAGADVRLLSGRYALHERIGSGGAGEVWRGDDRVLQRSVAVKLLRPEVAGDPDAVARFRAEASSAAKLTHPHAVMVFDIGRDGDQDYLVMELVAGHTLEHVLAAGALPAGVVATLGSQLGRALGSAHARGLVHRDVKPANVLIAPDGLAKLTDFGIARALGEATTRLTAPGGVMGTARYLAPEQLRDGDVDGRADVYALGLVLHQALTDRPPFGEGTPVEVAMRRLSVPLPRVADLRPDVPSSLDDAIARATRLDPADRYADGSEFASALARAATTDAARQLATRVARPRTPTSDPEATAAMPSTEATTAVPTEPTVAMPAANRDPVAPGPYRRAEPVARQARTGHRLVRIGLVALVVLAVGVAFLTGGERDAPPVGEDGAAFEIVDGGDHDPFGSGDEHPDEVPSAFDGEPSTFWRTERYRGNPELGGLKPGVGIWLDLGEPREVGEVVVATTNPGASFTVYAGDAPPSAGQAPQDWGASVAAVDGAGAEERIVLAEPSEARVWLLWFTSLPPDGDRFRATVSDVHFLPS